MKVIQLTKDTKHDIYQQISSLHKSSLTKTIATTLTTNRLSRLYIFMIKNNFHFTFTDYVPLLQSKNSIKKLKPTCIENFFNFDKFIKNSSINTSTMILEKKFIKNLNLKKIALMEDYVFNC